jgi:hypothetical protein
LWLIKPENNLPIFKTQGGISFLRQNTLNKRFIVYNFPSRVKFRACRDLTNAHAKRPQPIIHLIHTTHVLFKGPSVFSPFSYQFFWQNFQELRQNHEVWGWLFLIRHFGLQSVNFVLMLKIFNLLQIASLNLFKINNILHPHRINMFCSRFLIQIEIAIWKLIKFKL